MQLTDIMFYVFSALALACGLMVLLSRNPVTSVMFLVLTIASLAGLFVLLHAFFLAAVQVLVYAGAVMVLFLFVIMLLDLKTEVRRRINRFGLVAGIVSVGAITAIMARTIWTSGVGAGLMPEREGGTAALGKLLFTEY